MENKTFIEHLKDTLTDEHISAIEWYYNDKIIKIEYIDNLSTWVIWFNNKWIYRGIKDFEYYKLLYLLKYTKL